MTPGQVAFWDKVESCEHKWDPDYDDGGYCGTDYCHWTEKRCIKCRVYDVSCGCGFNNGRSGWPNKRYIRFWRKQSR